VVRASLCPRRPAVNGAGRENDPSGDRPRGRVPRYDALLPASTPVQAFGLEVRCLNLDRLIEVKRAAGRPRDLDAIAELEALLEERQRRRGD
jgi:hypothetical protein